MVIHIEKFGTVEGKHPCNSIAQQILFILEEGPLDCYMIARILNQEKLVVFRHLKDLIDAEIITKFPLHSKMRRNGRPKMLYAKMNWN